MEARKTRRTSRGAGWDAIAAPVPGDVLSCLQELGVEIIGRSGDEIGGRCPMHYKRLGKEDRHSSWSVNAESGVHNCFSCGYKGVFVQLVVDLLEVDWSTAAQWVRARGGIERARRVLNKAKGGAESAADTTKQINEASLALFIDPPAQARSARNLLLESCQFYGVLWDHEKEMWIIPIREPDSDRLIGWQEKTARHFRNRPYTMKKSGTLFGVNQFEDGEAILVESPLDVVRLDSAGITGGLACFGSAPSEVQMKLIQERTDTLIVAMDNPDLDRAGCAAAEQIQKNWPKRGMAVKFFDYSHTSAKDIGAMTNDEIDRGLANAYSSTVARFA